MSHALLGDAAPGGAGVLPGETVSVSVSLEREMEGLGGSGADIPPVHAPRFPGRHSQIRTEWNAS